MRIESSVTSISWIPSEAVEGLGVKVPFEMGVARYDQPPPEVLDDLDELHRAERFRFANELRGWIDVEDGRITGFGQSGGGRISPTTLRLGGRHKTFQAVALPDLRGEPDVRDRAVTFVQTAGGRTGVPTPRRVRRAPFVQIAAPLAWTTLALTMRVDGTSSHRILGASPFPRHWVYDTEGKLASKSGLIEFSFWYRRAFAKHSPWGDQDSPSLTTEVETALERQLSVNLMQGSAKPKIRRVKAGSVITEQGASDDELFLVLDGIVRVEVDGVRVAEYGPGSVHGERAALERGKRTSTVRAVTPCKLAVVAADKLDRAALLDLAGEHHREDSTSTCGQ